MRFSDILLEYNRDQTVKNFGAKVLAVAFKDTSIDYPGPLQLIARNPEKHAEFLNYVMGELERSDPTRNKNYAQALTKMYAVGDTPLEDFTSTMANDLVKFDKLKNKKKIQPEHADFMRFKSARQFMDIIAQYPDPDSELGSQKIAVTQIPEGLEYKIVYGKLDNQLRITTEVLIVQPLNEAASQWWARSYPTKEAAQTNKWCTGQPNGCLFNSYSRDGDLFIIIPQVRKQNDEKYQFYFSRGGGRRNEFAANDNRHLSDEQLGELATRFPAITYALKNYAVASNTLPLMPQEYKDKVGAHAQVAAKELDSTLEKFTDRVARFGFAELRKPEKYGIDIPQDTEEAMVPAIVEYISQVRQALMSENGLWAHIMKNLGSERNSSKIEIFLNSDKNLKQLMESSKAAQMVKQLAESSIVKNKMDAYHLQDVILRDPTFRICMTQIPKLYEKFLASLDIGQLKEGVNLKFHTTKLMKEDIESYAKQHFEAYNIEAPFSKFVSNIRKFGSSKLTESSEMNSIKPFIDSIHQLDSKKNIKVGDAFAVLQFELNIGWKEIEISGFTSPKKVSDIKLHGNGSINYILFSDGDRYPRLTPATYEGKPILQTAYFGDKKSAESSLSMLLLKVPHDWDVDTDHVNNIGEGKVKAVDIARQDYDTMTPQQFRGQYDMSRDQWKYDNKDLLATTQRKPKRTRTPKVPAVPNTVEAYFEYYDKRDQRQFSSKQFPDEATAKAWADKNNATIHNIIPLKGSL